MEEYSFPNPKEAAKTKIASFDFDGTIIRTKSKRRFPKDKDDWELYNDNVLVKLQSLHCGGYSIVVFTNQKNLEKRMKPGEFKEKCENVQKIIGVPMRFYVSLESGYMRKPFPGMFEYHKKRFPLVQVDSFYVGDAWSKKECFSDSDLRFAQNCQIAFYRAHDFFGQTSPVPYDAIMVNPFRERDTKFVVNQLNLRQFLVGKDYIFMISPPASGKTTFCERYMPEFVRLSKDDYKTLSQYRNAIKENADNRIVFDNTNSTFLSREKLLAYLPSKKVGYIVREVTKEQSMFLNKYRCFVSKGKEKLLPDVAIYRYYKLLQLPTGGDVYTISSSWITDHQLGIFYC